MATIQTPANIDGSLLSGTDGNPNRTYTISDLDSVISLAVQGVMLHEGSNADFTISGDVITFLNIIDNSNLIRIVYSTSVAVTAGTPYATNAQFIERSGFGIRVVDENVGTGNDSETDFDLDQDNIISGTFTISHAVSGSNNFTAMTENTHYTLDKESGRILLTASGVTEVGTDVIFATYWYSLATNDDVITDLIAAADEEIDILTRQRWGTATSVIEYMDGERLSNYPTTDRPYDSDWDLPQHITLKNWPITQIDFLYFLSQPNGVQKFFNFDSGSSAFTDKTDEVNSTAEAPFNLFDDSPVTGDIVYIGAFTRFLGMDIVLATAGTDNGSTSIDWEYWNGSDWTDLTETAETSGSDIFTASGKVTWTFPYGWVTNSVNSFTSFWIRGTLTDDYGTDPVVSTITVRDSISQLIEASSYTFDSYGRVVLTGARVPNGKRNVRVDYQYGQSTVPSYITELSIMTAAIKLAVNISGGSYDDATSYQIGSKQVGIGEAWVNLREVLAQFRTRVAEIYAMTGKRSDIAVI